jgi:hypothetical protein
LLENGKPYQFATEGPTADMHSAAGSVAHGEAIKSHNALLFLIAQVPLIIGEIAATSGLAPTD